MSLVELIQTLREFPVETFCIKKQGNSVEFIFSPAQVSHQESGEARESHEPPGQVSPVSLDSLDSSSSLFAPIPVPIKDLMQSPASTVSHPFHSFPEEKLASLLSSLHAARKEINILRAELTLSQRKAQVFQERHARCKEKYAAALRKNLKERAEARKKVGKEK